MQKLIVKVSPLREGGSWIGRKQTSSDSDEGIGNNPVSFKLPGLVQEDHKDHGYWIVVKEERNKRQGAWETIIAKIDVSENQVNEWIDKLTISKSNRRSFIGVDR